LSIFADVDRTLNLLWMPDGLSRCHSDFIEAFDMTEGEKLLTFGKLQCCKWHRK